MFKAEMGLGRAMFRGILTILLITGLKGSGGSKEEWENTVPT